MKNFRRLTAVAASALLISPSFAEDKTAPALAPGKPAGVHQAAIGTTYLGYGVVAIVVLGAVLIATTSDSSRAATSTSP